MLRMKSRWIVAVVSLGLMATLALPVAVFGQAAGAKSDAKTAAQTTPAAAVKADPTAVLKVIPADATAFVAIRNLRELDADITAISMKLGFPLGPNGMFPGPLDWVKENIGITQGLNANSSLAFVLLNCRQAKAVAEIPMRLAVLIPSADPKALAESLGAQKPPKMEGMPEIEGLLQLNLMNMPSMAIAKDGFLVVAQMPTVLMEIAKAKGDGVITSMAPDRVKAFSENDLYAWASVGGFSQEIRTEITQAITGLMAMANPAAAADASDALGPLEKMMNDVQEGTFGISLDATKGLLFTANGRVKAGTDFAKQWAAAKTVSGSTLLALPNEPTVLAIGTTCAMTPETQAQMQKTMGNAIKKFVGALGDKTTLSPADLQPLVDAYIKLVSDIEHMSAGVSGLPASEETIGDGLFGLTIVTKVKDNKAWCGQIREIITLAKELVIKIVKADPSEGEEDDVKIVNEAVQVKQAAETLGKTQVDHFAVDLSKIPDIAPEDLGNIKKIIGKEGVLLRFGAVGDKYVVITFGGGAKRFTQIAEHAAKEETPLANHPDIKKVANRLPTSNRQGEGYLNLDHLLTLVSNIANAVGQPIPFPLALQGAAPIAFTSTKVDDTAMQINVLVPMELVTSVTNLAKPIVGMMMMGGMGGGPTTGAASQPAPMLVPPTPKPAPGGGPGPQ